MLRTLRSAVPEVVGYISGFASSGVFPRDFQIITKMATMTAPLTASIAITARMIRSWSGVYISYGAW
jgi:hypothetical protein